MTTKRFLFTAVAALLIVVGSSAAGAWANPRQGGAESYGLVGGNATNPSFAGYQVRISTAVLTSTSEKFRLPPLNCMTNGSNVSSLDITLNLPYGMLIGSFLTTSTSLGLETNWGFAAVYENCKSFPNYIAELCLGSNGQYANCQATFDPNSGDLMKETVSVSHTASQAVLRDVTQAESVALSGPGSADLRLVGTGVESVFAPVFNFGKLEFFRDKVDGVTARAANAVEVNMETTTGILQVRTGALNTAGNAWTEVWKHS
jgi:hypothetical protein